MHLVGDLFELKRNKYYFGLFLNVWEGAQRNPLNYLKKRSIDTAEKPWETSKYSLQKLDTNISKYLLPTVCMTQGLLLAYQLVL